jgi:hypothetical protein
MIDAKKPPGGLHGLQYGSKVSFLVGVLIIFEICVMDHEICVMFHYHWIILDITHKELPLLINY